jgi:hypothetical protein
MTYSVYTEYKRRELTGKDFNLNQGRENIPSSGFANLLRF